MKIRCTNEQIIAMIKEQETGERTADVCRWHGISEGMFYKYKSKDGGMEASDLKRLRALEDENAKLPDRTRLRARRLGTCHKARFLDL